jgi:hypothetical protein
LFAGPIVRCSAGRMCNIDFGDSITIEYGLDEVTL